MTFAHPDLLFLLFLFLHIGGAIVGFGPTFAMPIISAMGGAEPRSANLTARIMLAIEQRLVGPMAVLVLLTGVGLIWTSGRDVFREAWLIVAIVLYLAALSLGLFVSAPIARRLVEATSAPPAGRDPEQTDAGAPPHVAALVKRAQAVGMTTAVLLVAVLLLMVFKPRF